MHRLAGWRQRCVEWRGLRSLRYLLVWPLIRAYRDCVRRSLRWRLAESHVGTVLLSVVAISLIGAIASVTQAFVQDPMAQEPAREAEWVAAGLEDLGWVDALAPVSNASASASMSTGVEVEDPAVLRAQEDASALLKAMASGHISPNPFTDDVNLISDIGRRLANISSISIVGQNQTVLASSEPLLNNQDAILIGPSALGVAQRALNGSTSTEANTRIVPGAGSIIGSYPLEDSTGRIVAAVVVDKKARTLPTGAGFVLLALEYVGKIALTIIVLVGIPAIPVGAVIGIRRARAIGKPVTQLAAAADAFAEQRLDARVQIDGDDEIATLGRRFNQMADRLQASMTREAAARARAEALLAANRELVANVSHELRTPVALVRAHLESLAGEPQHVDEYARIALRETDRLESLVNDLFQLARLEGQNLKLEREPFDAGGAVREAVESLVEPTRREAGLVLQAAVEPGNLRCVGDRARLVQVLQNLIRNAIRFTPEGGIVLVGARPEDDGVAVTVRDTGVGIPPEDVPHVFERFYRSEQSRNRSHGGAGLGLSIARQLIESMGGTIEVESELGEGTLFTIRLPREAAVPAPREVAEAGSRRPQAVGAA